ncbi:hypothetical protein ABIB30_001123 [Pedobacter sp. UYP1]
MPKGPVNESCKRFLTGPFYEQRFGLSAYIFIQPAGNSAEVSY